MARADVTFFGFLLQPFWRHLAPLGKDSRRVTRRGRRYDYYPFCHIACWHHFGAARRVCRPRRWVLDLSSTSPQNPHRNGRSMKPLGTRFGSHVGTQAGQGLPSGLRPVHPNRCVKPASSRVSSDTDPLGFEGMIHNSDKGMFSNGPPRLPWNSINLKLFNKYHDNKNSLSR